MVARAASMVARAAGTGKGTRDDETTFDDEITF
jgi:hypothetical protein